MCVQFSILYPPTCIIIHIIVPSISSALTSHKQVDAQKLRLKCRLNQT
ncbi:hypothetical protein M8C21_032366 [Ambrosia artemisiifolia]|uniref:Uncharacterized protein n=1 Tax=Ambrosia artemisiifolia TaxID=4212 RepID=A0AAD5BX91_AMBAR|nr:hypothetical protein M8C21_032366 [Ambrosia artemisiifolia]